MVTRDEVNEMIERLTGQMNRELHKPLIAGYVEHMKKRESFLPNVPSVDPRFPRTTRGDWADAFRYATLHGSPAVRIESDEPRVVELKEPEEFQVVKVNIVEIK